MNEVRTSGPTAATEHLVIPKPGLGIFLVRAGDKPRIRTEVARRPFPYIADHLPASEGAVAVGARRDIERSVDREIEVGPLQDW